MVVFHYDGTFEGLLAAIFDAYTHKCFPHLLLHPGKTAPLHASVCHQVQSRPDKADRVFTGLCKHLSERGREDVLRAWLAEEEDWDNILFRYMRNTFDASRSQEKAYGDKDVLAVERLAQKVRHEARHMCGFVRFQKSAQGTYFAAIAPRHNVLTLLLPHFAERFADQPWLIYDIGRGCGVLYDMHGFHEAHLTERQRQRLVCRGGRLDDADIAPEETLIRRLWQSFFNATVIPERVKPQLQARLMPRRYWPYMTEMQNG